MFYIYFCTRSFHVGFISLRVHDVYDDMIVANIALQMQILLLFSGDPFTVSMRRQMWSHNLSRTKPV